MRIQQQQKINKIKWNVKWISLLCLDLFLVLLFLSILFTDCVFCLALTSIYIHITHTANINQGKVINYTSQVKISWLKSVPPYCSPINQPTIKLFIKNLLLLTRLCALCWTWVIKEPHYVSPIVFGQANQFYLWK